MYRIIILVVILLFIAAPAYGIDIDQINKDWHEQTEIEQPDTQTSNQWNKLDIGYMILIGADWLQTRDIATSTYQNKRVDYNADGTTTITYIDKYTYNFDEANPLLGERPSLKTVDTYFFSVLLLNWLIINKANNDPEHWGKFKTNWVKIGFVLETYCVTKNISMGVDFKF